MRKALVSLLTLLLVSTALAQPDLRDRPDDLWRTGPFISPFHAVRWNDATPQVQVDGAWYELISLNDLPADQILAWCRELDAKDWQERQIESEAARQRRRKGSRESQNDRRKPPSDDAGTSGRRRDATRQRDPQ